MVSSPKSRGKISEVQCAFILALVASTYARILIAPPTNFAPLHIVDLVRLHVITAANVLLLITAFRCLGDLTIAVLGVTTGTVYGGVVLSLLKWFDVDPLSFSAAANVVTDNLGGPLICVGGTALAGFLAGLYHVTASRE